MNKEILFITGHRRSGTTMFANLFDDHKSFCVYPSDLCILYAYYPNFIGKGYSYKLKKERIISVLKNDLSNVLSEGDLLKRFNLKIFLKEMEKKINVKNIDNISKITKLLLESYIKTLKPKNNFRYLVIKETSADIFAFKIKNWFKKIKFIQIVRDPRDNYSSLKAKHKKHYSKFGESEKKLLASLINRAKLDLKFSIINQKLIGKKKYKTIKYENLVNKPKEELKKICKYLNVKFNNNLLYPSILGYKTIGNSYEGENFSKKISNAKVNKWRNRINPNEAQIVEFFMKEEMLLHKYKPAYKKINYDFILSFYQWFNKEFFFHDSFKKK